MQERPRDGVFLLLEEEQKALEVAQIAIDSLNRLPQPEAVLGIVVQMSAAYVCQGLHAALLDQEAPQPQVTTPEAHGIFVQPRRSPVALLEMLQAGELFHQPAGETCGARRRVKRLVFDLHQPTGVHQEAAELRQGVAADLGPLFTDPFGDHVLEGGGQVALQVDLGMRFQGQTQDMTCHGDVDGADDELARPAA